MQDVTMKEAEDETIKVSVKTLDGKIYHFNVSPDLPVPRLKDQIQEATKVPVTQQRLIFQGRVLKDEHNLAFYSIKDSHVLHMVERPPDVAPPTAQARAEPTPAPQQRPQTNVPPPQPVRNIVMGTITIPSEAQQSGAIDLNTLVSNVLNHFGLPLGETVRLGSPSGPSNSTSTSTPQGRPQPFSSTHRQNLCDNIARLLDAATSTSSQGGRTSERNDRNQSRNAVETIGHHLSLLESLTSRSGPLINQLSDLLLQESTLNELARRREAQQLATQLGPILQQLGTLMLVLSPTLSSLQMGDVAGMASSQPVHTHQVLTPTDNIAIRIQNVDMPDVHASSVQSRPPQSPLQSGPTQPQSPLQPPQRVPSQTSTSVPSPTAQPTTTRPQGSPPFDLSAMISSVLQGMPPPTTPSSTTPATPPQPAQQSPPLDFNSMMAQVLGSLSQPPSQQSSTQSNSSARPTAPPGMGFLSQLLANRPQPGPQSTASTPAGPMGNNPFGMMMSQLLSGMGGAPPRTDQPAEIDLTSPSDHNAALMSSMINTITNAMNAVQSQGGSAPPTVSSIIATMSQQHQRYQNTADQMVSDHEGALGDILQLVMDKMTVPDLIRLLQGDWTRVEQLQGAIAAYLRAQGVESSDPDKIEQMSNEIVQSLAESLDENTLPTEVKSKIVPGHNITQEALGAIQRHISKLLTLILTPLTPSPTNPCPFATSLRDWTRLFVGDLIGTLAAGFNGGVNDASQFVQFFLQTRLSFMEPEAANMAASLITSYVMNTYANFEQSQQNGSGRSQPQLQQSPLPRPQARSPSLAPTGRTLQTGQNGIPLEWAEIIAADEVRQLGLRRPDGYSEAYLSGGVPAKSKKKTSTTSNKK